MSTTTAKTLDLKGLACPLPIAKTAQGIRKTAQGIRELRSGELIEALATDPGSVPDFAAWCRATGNKLVEQIELAKDLGVKLVPCQMTMDLLGLTSEDLIVGLGEPTGATTALLEAQDAVALFI